MLGSQRLRVPLAQRVEGGDGQVGRSVVPRVQRHVLPVDAVPLAHHLCVPPTAAVPHHQPLPNGILPGADRPDRTPRLGGDDLQIALLHRAAQPHICGRRPLEHRLDRARLKRGGLHDILPGLSGLLGALAAGRRLDPKRFHDRNDGGRLLLRPSSPWQHRLAAGFQGRRHRSSVSEAQDAAALGNAAKLRRASRSVRKQKQQLADSILDWRR
mmetsp:Transcript_44018/g.129688  ORF Transcript_44018/g.129688 Transcript_44018/m.129688 type:complete len:213 (-) Transcript_44018:1274-1912(-)